MNVTTLPSAAPAAASDVDSFAITSTASLQERHSRTLKQGDTFAMFDGAGNIPDARGAPEGLYHHDTRYLSHLDLLVGGARPVLLSATLRDDNATMTCDLTNPDLRDLDGLMLEHDRVHVRRTRFVWENACSERIAIRNYAPERHRIEVEIRFGADFADLFEVRGMSRPRRGRMHATEVAADSVRLGYTGLDDRARTLALRFFPRPTRLESQRAVFELDLPPDGRAVLHLDMACDAPMATRDAREVFFIGLRDARRALRRSAGRAASIEGSNEVFNEAVRRSVSDLYMLITDMPCGAYPYAGIPWYSTAFGRDAIITAMFMLWMDPLIARGVLLFLAANQATTTDALADAEPGKILHEVRQGEMAELGEVPFRRYYGSVDATPLFVMLAGAHLERTGDVATAQLLWPHVEAAMAWIDKCGDRDGDGFVEYARMSGEGLANQGWKDSYDSVFHADGSTATGPIALVEVQGYVYAAQRGAAAMARALGHIERAAALDAQAETLRSRIEAAFWCEEIGTYAMALDGEKRPCRVRTSNAGHLLLAGVPGPERAARVAAQLLGSASFSGWGVRTVAASEPRYNPMSYHNGSVWPHDNAVIAMGFGRYGLRVEAARLLVGLFDASATIELRRLPELICGFPRRQGQGPTFYPVACAPQAWASASLLSLLQSCLGLSFDPHSRTVSFDNPVLPAFADRIILRQLSVGGAMLDVLLRRSGDSVAMSVLSRRGEIRATMTS